MANPAIVACPADEWTKVATNAVSGTVYIIDRSPNKYLQTYRETEDPAPTVTFGGVTLKDGAQISAVAGIDVYVYPMGKAGSVRVDLP